MRARIVVAAAALAVASVAVGLRGAAPQPVAAAPACPAAAHHAEIVVEHSDGASLSQCLGFAGATISGETVVRESGIEYDMQEYGSYGEAVCQLDNEPQTVPSGCFGTTSYWELFVSRACGPWHASNVGVSSLQLGDGDLEGFHFVTATSSGAPPGPAGYCPPVATPAPATAPAATATPTGAHPSPGRVTAAPAHAATPPPATASASAAVATADSSPSPTGAVAALPSDAASPIAAGPLRRTGDAPPPAPSGAPAWAYGVGGALVVGLGGSLGWRLRRRRE